MTAHRHFGDTAEFAAAVEQLADPLSDPLPNTARHAARPAQEAATEPATEPAAESPTEPAAEPTEPTTTPPATAQPVAPQASVPGRRSYEPGFQGSVRPAYEAPPADPWPVPSPASVPAPGPEEPPEPRSRHRGPAEQPYAEGARPVRRPLTDEERAAARRRVAGAPGDTMAMPAVTGPEAERVREAERERDRDPEREETPQPSPDAPAPEGGGRAARRKAAQEAARRGGRGRRRSGPAAASQAATEAATAPTASTPAAPRSRMEARRAARAAKESPAVIASRVAGEVFITLGVLMLLFVTYQLWWTNVLAHQQAGGAANNLQKQWEGEKGPNRDPGAFTPGQGFAIMYIPKLDVKAPIAEGIDKHKVLDKGMIGHYSGELETAMPWDKKGNFSLAAHRNTHGEPFRYVNKLVAGDKVVVETESTYYTYEVTSMLPSTPPSNISVIKPIPVGSGFTKPGRYITLTTCTPEFTSKFRLIVWGKMVEERPRSKGKPDALVE
ncbi:class E sortase [Actinacidiphila glaucinigra]|uniref:Sortase A n=1 Tax=Actinacidiphila glaucinigra TaxID=235986 RepID=A0A239NR99_9ACTN|nr:class E sortase [Actinacidiphila glaucinigra]SNT57417.1 sortase A [Actinacidiphila glaucinigra]